MQKELHQIFPAESYIPGGTLTDIDLSCINDNGKILPVKISRVLLQIIEDETFSVQEITAIDEDHNFATDVIYATKIYNPCTAETVYVAEYFNDIYPFIYCCPVAVTPSETFFLIDSDNGYLLDSDNGHNFYE